MKKGLIALVAVIGIVASTALVTSVTDAFGFGKSMDSERPTTEEITEHMQEKGFTEEEISEKLTDREEHKAVHISTLAELMGIDSATLTSELETSTMPELLDKYEVSHVELHDTMQELKGEFKGTGFGHKFKR